MITKDPTVKAGETKNLKGTSQASNGKTPGVFSQILVVRGVDRSIGDNNNSTDSDDAQLISEAVMVDEGGKVVVSIANTTEKDVTLPAGTVIANIEKYKKTEGWTKDRQHRTISSTRNRIHAGPGSRSTGYSGRRRAEFTRSTHDLKFGVPDFNLSLLPEDVV